MKKALGIFLFILAFVLVVFGIMSAYGFYLNFPQRWEDPNYKPYLLFIKGLVPVFWIWLGLTVFKYGKGQYSESNHEQNV
ncbi:hypothetical protein [Neptuniibacter caesariensis]|uniref:Uncharacterized protein n=1 Tax=Neptuniibacter caesariensis TaxID=207954 RepID=A0A7U8GPQ7_NEPCE|nr:hypothetical protein [Neptuniibacter caesariensis]EAR59562.1 hypothetical protein MED92_11614 [Oceanospirillum sp. MED92] [Neptuniibacter caesariensis]